MSLLCANQLAADDLAALRDALPGWVVFWAWFAAPVAAALLTLPLIWLTHRWSRYGSTGAHWTRVARRHHSATIRLWTIVYFAWLSVVALVLVANGELACDATVARIAVGVSLISLGASVCALRLSRRVHPRLTVRLFVEGQLLSVVLFSANAVISAVMAVSGPDVGAEDACMPIAFYGVGTGAMLIVACGGLMPVLRLVRLMQPASERVRTIVTRACARTGTKVPRVWEARHAMANAFALPMTGELLFTTGAVEGLEDRELQAIALHEIGHLREERVERWSRVVRVAPWIVLACWRPIVAWSGGPGLVASFAIAMLIAVRAHRLGRRLEEKADRHALDHEDQESRGDYARALESLHRVNLMPAVVRSKRSTHPHLYDRMIEAGVQPDYERPLPPKDPKLPRAIPKLWVAMLGFAILFVYALEGRSDFNANAALLAIVVGGGDARAIGDLGCHWRQEHPARAEVLLRFATEHTTWPEYPARLALLLAGRDPRAARVALERAEYLVREGPGRSAITSKWQPLLDGARAAVADAERR